MVTEIIKQNDVHTHYMIVNHWIQFGITYYAVFVFKSNWTDRFGIYCNSDKVRNKTDDIQKNIYPLNKW